MICGMRLSVLDGPDTFVEFPTDYGSRDNQEDDFNRACRAIGDEWKARAHQDSKERAHWLQFTTYQLLCYLFDHGLTLLIDERLQAFGRYSRGNETRANPFQRGLLAIFAHEKRHLSPNDELRSRASRRLLHAYRHYVPYQFLRGFLNQVGDAGLKEKVTHGALEPDFEEWVIERRYADERPEARGQYPEHIEEFIIRFRELLPIIEQA